MRAVLFEQEGGGIPLESYYYLSSEIEFNRVLEVRAQLLVKNWAQSDYKKVNSLHTIKPCTLHKLKGECNKK